MENPNQTTPTPAVPQERPAPAQTPQPENGSAGPIIGTIIILAVIVLGGLYFWSQRGTDDSLITEDQVNAEVQEINTQSDSDDVSSIEADLNATDVDSIDSELNAY